MEKPIKQFSPIPKIFLPLSSLKKNWKLFGMKNFPHSLGKYYNQRKKLCQTMNKFIVKRVTFLWHFWEIFTVCQYFQSMTEMVDGLWNFWRFMVINFSLLFFSLENYRLIFNIFIVASSSLLNIFFAMSVTFNFRNNWAEIELLKVGWPGLDFAIKDWSCNRQQTYGWYKFWNFEYHWFYFILASFMGTPY